MVSRGTGPVAGTIATRSRLPEARALASRSFRQPRRPAARGRAARTGRSRRPGRAVRVARCRRARRSRPSSSGRCPCTTTPRHDVAALKPWLLRHLLDATGGPVRTLAADGHVFGDLTPLVDPATGVGRRPRARTCWRRWSTTAAGPTSATSPTPVSTTRDPAIADTAAGASCSTLADRSRGAAPMDDAGATDGRWTDLLPGFVAHELCTDPGIGVSYLNLHERPLAIAGDALDRRRRAAAPVPLLRLRRPPSVDC